MRKAAELEPDRSHYAYVYAVALHSSGRRDEAMTRPEDALKNHPGDREILRALVSFKRMAGDAAAALGYAEQLAVVTPEDRSLATLIQELRQAKDSGPMTALRPRPVGSSENATRGNRRRT